MFDVISLLKQRSKSSFVLDNNYVVFNFEFFAIHLKFESDIDIKNWNTFEMNYFNTIQIVEVRISDSEYLGDRLVQALEKNNFKSMSNLLLQLVKRITEINKIAITHYHLDTNYGYSSGDDAICQRAPNFIYLIYISLKIFCDKLFVENLLSIKLEQEFAYNFYLDTYFSGSALHDSKQLQILNTNTKARRLGYFKILANFLREKARIPVTKINSSFEKYCIKFNDQIQNYKNVKGLVQVTRTGNSAKPYIQIASDLNFIKNVSGMQSAGKHFKVYQILRDENEFNIFFLNTLDKMFFTESFLRTDYFYIVLILEMIYVGFADNYLELRNNFQSFLQERINNLIQAINRRNNQKDLTDLKIIMERVKMWSNAPVYLEHVLMPRLNWLYDLDIILMDQQQHLELTEGGVKYLKNFNFWNDINSGYIYNSNEFVRKFFVHTFETANHLKEPKMAIYDTVYLKLENYVEESFHHFRTLAPNRVTASQAISYAKYKLYINDNICTSDLFIENFLLSNHNKRFVYKYQKQFGDGYIQKIQ
ncbi:hypothetical protein OQY15_04700 [Pedobacter sp. MC2016-15]|uniref:hypothetical protein n=1 Tax=Pedobacter sp. MC2016-15 TaxID=2994473 RepID=UPI00224852B7|nr:hypothetical protein [Pedobacter sp. MC2016-15]MCX2478377.1 hypothetical protein [Pedobacter sp. MC2016-15]